MFGLFKKKTETPKVKVLRFVKEAYLNSELNIDVSYHTELVTKDFYENIHSDRIEYIDKSYFKGIENESKALEFFNKVVELKGNTRTTEVIKEVVL